MTARALLAAVWRRRWLALAVLIVVLAVVAGWVNVAPRRYTATATITATPSAALLSSTGNYDDLEATLAHMANSRSVLADVRDRLGGSPAVATLRDEVSGARLTGTVLLQITVEDPQAQRAARIANAVAAVLPLHDPSGGLFVFTQTDPARAPTDYSSPDTKVIWLVGAVLGLMLAAACALLRDRTARTVETAGQLRSSSGTDVLATVPRPADFVAIVGAEQQDPVAVAMRSLRVELDYASSSSPTGPIVIADAAARDCHASWLAMNLAVALAQVDHRVLLVDGNFVDGHPHEQLADSDSPGLYGVLRGDSDVMAALRPGPCPGVSVLPAGDVPATGNAALVELRFGRLLEQLVGKFDAVLVLAPAPDVSDDARVMAINGSVLLVVGARSVRESRLRELIGDLRATRTRVLGAVLVSSKQRARV